MILTSSGKKVACNSDIRDVIVKIYVRKCAVTYDFLCCVLCGVKTLLYEAKPVQFDLVASSVLHTANSSHAVEAICTREVSTDLTANKTDGTVHFAVIHLYFLTSTRELNVRGNNTVTIKEQILLAIGSLFLLSLIGLILLLGGR